MLNNLVKEFSLRNCNERSLQMHMFPFLSLDSQEQIPTLIVSEPSGMTCEETLEYMNTLNFVNKQDDNLKLNCPRNLFEQVKGSDQNKPTISVFKFHDFQTTPVNSIEEDSKSTKKTKV